jgi:PIN domain nuclease of toxin-antitoxin system
MPKRVNETVSQYPHVQPILLDTHVAVWLSADSNLKASVRSKLERAYRDNQLFLSPISAWEIGMLVAKKRLDFGESPLGWLQTFISKFRIKIADLTPEIAINSTYLPGELPGDPADRILVATARAHSAMLASADEAILSYAQEGYVKVLRC